MKAAERRKKLLRLLDARRQEKISNLAFELEVSVKTIKNDIAVLSLSYPIYTVPGRYYSGVFVAENFHYSKRSYLSEKETEVLSQLREIVNNEQRIVIDKILKDFSKSGHKGN